MQAPDPKDAEKRRQKNTTQSGRIFIDLTKDTLDTEELKLLALVIKQHRPVKLKSNKTPKTSRVVAAAYQIQDGQEKTIELSHSLVFEKNAQQVNGSWDYYFYASQDFIDAGGQKKVKKASARSYVYNIKTDGSCSVRVQNPVPADKPPQEYIRKVMTFDPNDPVIQGRNLSLDDWKAEIKLENDLTNIAYGKDTESKIVFRDKDNGVCKAYIKAKKWPGKDLQGINNDHKNLPVEARFKICAEIAAELQRINNQGILHRDVTLKNIMVNIKTDGEISVKFVDFGLSRYNPTGDDKSIPNNAGTYPFRPFPATDVNYDLHSEVYSLAVVFIATLLGVSGEELRKKVNWDSNSNHNAVLQLVDELDDEFDDKDDARKKTIIKMLNTMLAANPNERPSIDDVTQFFANLVPTDYKMPAIKNSISRDSASRGKNWSSILSADDIDITSGLRDINFRDENNIKLYEELFDERDFPEEAHKVRIRDKKDSDVARVYNDAGEISSEHKIKIYTDHMHLPQIPDDEDFQKKALYVMADMIMAAGNAAFYRGEIQAKTVWIESEDEQSEKILREYYEQHGYVIVPKPEKDADETLSKTAPPKAPTIVPVKPSAPELSEFSETAPQKSSVQNSVSSERSASRKSSFS